MKLLPSRGVLCTPYNHAPCHFMQSHIRKVHACLTVTCHLHLWQNDRDNLPAKALQESAQKVDPGEENSFTALLQGTRDPRPFNHKSAPHVIARCLMLLPGRGIRKGVLRVQKFRPPLLRSQSCQTFFP